MNNVCTWNFTCRDICQMTFDMCKRKKRKKKRKSNYIYILRWIERTTFRLKINVSITWAIGQLLFILNQSYRELFHHLVSMMYKVPTWHLFRLFLLITRRRVVFTAFYCKLTPIYCGTRSIVEVISDVSSKSLYQVLSYDLICNELCL